MLWSSSASALAEMTSPDSDELTVVPSMGTGQLAADTLADVLRNPRTINAQVLAGIRADPELVGSGGQHLLTIRSEIEAAQSELKWAFEEQQLRHHTTSENKRIVARGTRDLAIAVADQAVKERNLRVMSVDAFISGSDEPGLEALMQAQADTAATVATQSLRTQRLAIAATDDLIDQRDDAVAARVRSQRELLAAREWLEREQSLLAHAIAVERDALVSLEYLEPLLAPAEGKFERELLTRALPGTEDLTIVAVDAYYNASTLAFQRWPGCRIAWHQLAGVGRVESIHGTFGSSDLTATGSTSAKILGPQLNGDPWLAIPDTDQGMLDDDIEWDRAVGPMQFIPSSWAIFAADGDDNGVEDPHNLYDAALGAADHLCGDSLDTTDRFRAALLGYNRSARYGYDVMKFSDEYAAQTTIEDPWNIAEHDEPAGSN
jgi:hypothetical protein